MVKLITILEMVKLIRILEWKVNNLETALKNNEIEKHMIPIAKRNIEEKKEKVKIMEDYIKLII